MSRDPGANTLGIDVQDTLLSRVYIPHQGERVGNRDSARLTPVQVRGVLCSINNAHLAPRRPAHHIIPYQMLMVEKTRPLVMIRSRKSRSSVSSR